MITNAGTGKALIVGATGIVGRTLSEQLANQGRMVYGLSRSKTLVGRGMTSLQANLLDASRLASVLQGTGPDLVAFTAWILCATKKKNIEANSAMVRNVFLALEAAKSVQHAALVTEMKHYLGPFEHYARGMVPDTPVHESDHRLNTTNFYYAQKDELVGAAARLEFTWNVHRPHTVFGFATGNPMNMVLTLVAYATLCREQGLPFVFPGSEVHWTGVTDVTDAELIGEQILSATTHPSVHNQAFNIANGDVFRWRWLCPQIADCFRIS